jgi:serine acetyltransferase
MTNLRCFLARSEHPVARTIRGLYRLTGNFSVPAPTIIVKPLLWMFLAGRGAWHFFLRVFVCEPIFKAYCKKYGRGLHTDVFIHWITGKGDIILGDDVVVDGKCGFGFATRFTERPTLRIGDHTGIGHGCTFTVAKSVTIGSYCRIAGHVWIFDSPGHPSDPAKRLANLPPDPNDVRPVSIGDNVWIGQRAIIFPGVTIGENSIVGPAAVVTSDVPPNTVVFGNPARKIAALAAPEPRETAPGIVSTEATTRPIDMVSS